MVHRPSRSFFYHPRSSTPAFENEWKDLLATSVFLLALILVFTGGTDPQAQASLKVLLEDGGSLWEDLRGVKTLLKLNPAKQVKTTMTVATIIAIDDDDNDYDEW